MGPVTVTFVLVFEYVAGTGTSNYKLLQSNLIPEFYLMADIKLIPPMVSPLLRNPFNPKKPAIKM